MQQLELRLRTMTNKLRRLRFWVLAVSATGLLCGGAWCVAAAPVSSENASNTVAAAAAGTNVAAIPLVEVAPQAEAAFGNLQSIEGNLSADEATVAIQQELPALARESSVRLEESSRMLGANPSLESLRRLNGEWQGFREELADWKRSLKKRVTQLDEDRERLTQLEKAWEATHASVLTSNVPPEVVALVGRVMAAVKRTQDKAEAQQMVALSLQTRVAEQDGRAAHTLNAIERAREAVIRRLFVQDAPPI